jgi:uncharacterized protein YndB with AHSA1/START domain
MTTPDHVYSVYVQADAERIWRALTEGGETEQYYYSTRVGSDWKPGSRVVYQYPDGTVAADGEVLEIDPPRRLAMTFHARWDPEIEAEGPVRQTWEIEPAGPEASKLTVITSGMGPKTAKEFAGGMVYIVSGLKTFLETGQRMAVAAG